MSTTIARINTSEVGPTILAGRISEAIPPGPRTIRAIIAPTARPSSRQGVKPKASASLPVASSAMRSNIEPKNIPAQIFNSVLRAKRNTTSGQQR